MRLAVALRLVGLIIKIVFPLKCKFRSLKQVLYLKRQLIALSMRKVAVNP